MPRAMTAKVMARSNFPEATPRAIHPRLSVSRSFQTLMAANPWTAEPIYITPLGVISERILLLFFTRAVSSRSSATERAKNSAGISRGRRASP